MIRHNKTNIFASKLRVNVEYLSGDKTLKKYLVGVNLITLSFYDTKPAYFMKN